MAASPSLPSPPPAAVGVARRPIAARGSPWAARTARWLGRRGVTPDAISLASIGCGAAAGAALLATRWMDVTLARSLLFVLAVAAIQCRLLCNLFDGMVAVEGGRAGPAGEVYNDFPDRVADPLVLVAAGYAAGGAWGEPLGWGAALLAVLTAYVRVLGRSLGAGVYFIGPMAKQHRMATLSAACLLAAAGAWWDLHRAALLAALALVCVGSLITIWRRTRRIVRDLEERAAAPAPPEASEARDAPEAADAHDAPGGTR